MRPSSTSPQLLRRRPAWSALLSPLAGVATALLASVTVHWIGGSWLDLLLLGSFSGALASAAVISAQAGEDA